MKGVNFKHAKRLLSTIILLLFILLSFYFFDLSNLLTMFKKLLNRPDLLIFIMVFYFFSFCIKAWVWKLYLSCRPGFISCLLGILYSLFINHISPIKAGDLVRAGILSSREAGVTAEEALHSVIVLRILDSLCLMMFTTIGLMVMNIRFSVSVWAPLAALIGISSIVFFIKKRYSAFFARQFRLLKIGLSGMNGLLILLLTVLSWVLEASVLFGTVLAIKHDLSFFYAIWINSLTVAGQVFQITPGGIANYETIMTFGLKLIGFPMKDGYTIAIMTHGVKFIFSYLCGAFALYYYPITLSRIKGWVKQEKQKHFAGR